MWSFLFEWDPGSYGEEEKGLFDGSPKRNRGWR